MLVISILLPTITNNKINAGLCYEFRMTSWLYYVYYQITPAKSYMFFISELATK